MRLLLDTHAFLWFILGSGKLTARARSLIEDPHNEKFISLASICGYEAPVICTAAELLGE